MSTQQTVESWQPKRKKTVKRDAKAYQQALEFTTKELERLLNMYRNEVFDEDMQARLIRDSIDHHLRRYHKYAIQGSIKSHYKQKGASMASADCIFEHVIPAGQVRDMLIDSKLTINQALNVPTCRVSRKNNKLLNEQGLHDSNSTPYYPFRRYVTGMSKKGVAPEFEAYNGKTIEDLANWTLDDHWKLFDIKET
jgi:hypothetical protein